MSRRSVLSLAAVAGAALLVLLAVDAMRWERRLKADDARFAAAPMSVQLWQAQALLPAGATQRLLGLRDDVAYRRALRQFWPVRPGRPIMGPELETLRGVAETDLARISRSSTEAAPRAHLLNLLGVLTIGRYYGSYYGFTGGGPTDPAERALVLRTAIGLFQSAIEADPGTVDAKLNLELLLRDPGAQQFLVDTPAGSAAEGRATGAGAGGGGY